MNVNEIQETIADKMGTAGVGLPTINGFLNAVRKVAAGERGMLPESAVDPVTDLPRFDAFHEPVEEARPLLEQLAVIKLNGGLGTSMGLDRAKSLIPVKGEETFLDFIAHQIFHLRGGPRPGAPAFYLMNSFATQKDTLEYLRKHPGLAEDGRLDFLQSKVPKLDAQTLLPVDWPQQPELEWCPPGHGDLYPALLGSGLLDELLGKGAKFLFVSNSDNLGATADLRLLRYFAESGFSFLMEVAERTPADRKGGHLARNKASGRLVLRESAQCPKDDEAAFQDIQRHPFFNTNSLWVRIDHLKEELDRHGGSLPLPLITNSKTVDPRKPDSPRVLQLESAMGAAIECFERSGAVVVPRTRFSPVKTTSDLLALRSDAYEVTGDYRLVLAASRAGEPPVIELDSKHCKLLPDFDRTFSRGVPSLAGCERFKTIGPLQFEAGVVCEGSVEFVNVSAEARRVTPGTYRDVKVEL